MNAMKLAAPLAAGLLLAGGSYCWSDEMAHAVVRVFVTVEPTLTVIPTEPAVQLGSVQTGLILGDVPFRVESNSATVRFSVGATHLYKSGRSDIPLAESVPPIPIRREMGVRLSADHASPTGGRNDVAEYLNSEGRVEGFPALVTEDLDLESSEDNRFSQYVSLQVAWLQDDPEKPTGEYSGTVVLWAMVPPPDNPVGAAPASFARVGY